MFGWKAPFFEAALEGSLAVAAISILLEFGQTWPSSLLQAMTQDYRLDK